MTIRFLDGSFYEGPYIGEEWIDQNGYTLPKARARDHYGVFKCPDGRVFEGSNVDNHFDPLNIQVSGWVGLSVIVSLVGSACCM